MQVPVSSSEVFAYLFALILSQLSKRFAAKTTNDECPRLTSGHLFDPVLSTYPVIPSDEAGKATIIIQT
jgi:hypothetical protein